MEKKENIREYLQKMLDRWNKYDELDGFVAESFRVDLEKTLEYWDLRIADNKEELDKARREYFSMGMEYFSLIDDSNIYQKKGWKLPEEKAERLQILDKIFNLLKDNK
ncbi:MAG: hypothetical protein BWY21_01678 [Parcubacteria group bacterium ADurb.Bin216]|nr:MAG: hypothetical protein BWY21_01678 [Parcubacteria group bacterium ADurb.Bin216]